MLLEYCYPDSSFLDLLAKGNYPLKEHLLKKKTLGSILDSITEFTSVKLQHALSEKGKSFETCPIFLSSLFLFEHFKSNFSGPVNHSFLDFFNQLTEFDQLSLTLLDRDDGEILSSFCIKSPFYLAAAKLILGLYGDLIDHTSAINVLIIKVLNIRVLFYQQKLFTSSLFFSSLYEKILILCEDIFNLAKTNPLSHVELILALYEILSIYLYFKEEKRAKLVFETLLKCTKKSMKWTGMLGRRLLHQHQKYPLLCVEIIEASTVPALYDTEVRRGTSLPEVISFKLSGDDDKFLETPEIDTEISIRCCSYLELFFENLMLLSVFNLILINTPSSDLRTEQLRALLETILSNYLNQDKAKINWTLFSTVLALRSIYVEGTINSKAVRSCLQLESLTAQIMGPLKENEFIAQRLEFCWSVPSLFSALELQRHYGGKLQKLGAPLSAYEVFLKLGDIPSAINALIAAGEKEKALNRLTSFLAEEIPLSNRLPLLCLLADLRDGEISIYQQAWELSGSKYAPAQRSIGFSQHARKNYLEAINAFELALKINPHFTKVWYTLGYCYIKLENYQAALGAFRMALGISGSFITQDDHQETSISEIWASISLTLCLLGNTTEAFSAIQEAVKGNYDDWRLWENYLTLALKLGEDPMHVLLAFKRLEVIKGGSTDWGLFDVVFNSIPLKSEADEKIFMSSIDWLISIERHYGNTCSYWTRRARMTKKLKDKNSSFQTPISEWDSLIRAYQTITFSLSCSNYKAFQDVINLLELMIEVCPINKKEQLMSIFKTIFTRFSQSLPLEKDDWVEANLKKLQNFQIIIEEKI